jgi:hypothetical protein
MGSFASGSLAFGEPSRARRGRHRIRQGRKVMKAVGARNQKTAEQKRTGSEQQAAS